MQTHRGGILPVRRRVRPQSVSALHTARNESRRDCRSTRARRTERKAEKRKSQKPEVDNAPSEPAHTQSHYVTDAAEFWGAVHVPDDMFGEVQIPPHCGGVWSNASGASHFGVDKKIPQRDRATYSQASLAWARSVFGGARHKVGNILFGRGFNSLRLHFPFPFSSPTVVRVTPSQSLSYCSFLFEQARFSGKEHPYGLARTDCHES